MHVQARAMPGFACVGFERDDFGTHTQILTTQHFSQSSFEIIPTITGEGRAMAAGPHPQPQQQAQQEPPEEEEAAQAATAAPIGALDVAGDGDVEEGKEEGTCVCGCLCVCPE